MKTSDILQLDCREEANRKIIQKVLRRVKPLSKCPETEDIPIDKIERLIKLLCEKYGVRLGYMFPDVKAGKTEIIWRMEIYLSEMNKISVFGCSVYECLAKSAIAIYSRTRKETGSS